MLWLIAPFLPRPIAFYIGRHISSIQKIILWHKIARVFTLFCLTHIYNGAFCDTFFRGSILPAGEHCEPAGKIEPRKKVSQNPHYICVFIRYILIKKECIFIAVVIVTVISDPRQFNGDPRRHSPIWLSRQKNPATFSTGKKILDR